MELKIEEYQLPAQILFNFEELKTELEAKVHHYESVVYTDDQIKAAKADKAALNNLKKALNDERIRREREYLEPFNQFKAQINEIIAIIERPVAIIDKQIKAFDEKQKAEKRSKIEELFDTIGFQGFVKLDMIFEDEWLNASVSMKKIEEAMLSRMYRISTDMYAISKLADFSFEAEEVYKTSLDIEKAINEAQRMVEIAKKKAETTAETERVKGLDGTVYVQDQDKQGFTPAEEPVNQWNKQWVSFKALLSNDDARALKAFFNSRNIEFGPVE